MSSHHFVKEGQEPALLILEAISFSRVQPLLEWSPLVIVADTVLERVNSWGIKIDAVLICEDDIDEWQTYIQEQAPIKVIFYKGKTLLSNAFDFLEDTRQRAVNICAVNPEEFIKKQVNLSRLRINVLGDYFHWSLIADGLFKKWLSSGTVLKVITSNLQELHTSGLTRTGMQFMAIQNGLVAIESGASFWVGEALN